MSARRMRSLVVAVTVGVGAAWSPLAHADQAQCFSAPVEGQKLRQAGKLLAARERFLACAQKECPKEIVGDCDADTVLLKVKQIGGAACHEGYPSCFFRKLEGPELTVVGERVFDPKDVYNK